jgi:hypothetical protein
MKMEIKFELENSDTEYIFTPDFVVSANHADETAVSWRLSNDLTAVDVGVLFPGIQAKNSIRTPGSDRDDM